MAFMEFVFSGFWHFAGTAFMLCIVGYYLVCIVALIAGAITGSNVNIGSKE